MQSAHGWIRLVGVLVVSAAALSVLGGCGSGPGGWLDGNGAVVQTYLRPFTDNVSQTPRWMDIAENLYSTAFQASYRYPDGVVRLDYTTQESPLRFTVTAGSHALKPNFCYQMKIEGPAKPWSGDPTGSDLVNHELGSNGRWWCDYCNRNLTTAEVDSGAHLGHVVKGYLYFDFLVTQADGSIAQTSTANSSYHVTWKTSQRARTANDGPVRSCVVASAADKWGYGKRITTKTVGLYGEWEPDRALTGQVQLAPGLYEGVEFRLTEESFHSTKLKGGKWRTVMYAPDLSFQVE
jgi:hypothetical protein